MCCGKRTLSFSCSEMEITWQCERSHERPTYVSDSKSDGLKRFT